LVLFFKNKKFILTDNKKILIIWNLAIISNKKNWINLKNITFKNKNVKDKLIYWLANYLISNKIPYFHI